MSIRRAAVSLLLTAVPALVPTLVPTRLAAQDPAPGPALAQPARLAATIAATDDRPEFAAREAGRVLQNLAEVVRQLGARVARVDTVGLAVTRLPEANGAGGYPPPPYVARYVLRVELASAGDVVDVSTALSAAGAASVRRVDAVARGGRHTRLRR